MTNTQVHVVARVQSKPGSEEAVRRMLHALLEPSRRERGCLSYELFQARDNPTAFVFLERWENDVLLDAHLAGPTIQSALPGLMPLLAAPPEIVRYQPVG